MAVNAGLVLQILGVATGAIGAAVCLGYGLWRFLALALGAAWTALGPRTPGSPDPRVGPYGGTEPGQPAYWARQMWTDAGAAARAAAHTVRYLLVHHWLDEIVRHRLLNGRGGSTGDRAGNALGRLLLRLLAPATALAALLSALLSCALLLGVALAFAAQLLLVSAVALTGVAAGRSAERLWKLARGIRMKCPSPAATGRSRWPCTSARAAAPPTASCGPAGTGRCGASAAAGGRCPPPRSPGGGGSPPAARTATRGCRRPWAPRGWCTCR